MCELVTSFNFHQGQTLHFLEMIQNLFKVETKYYSNLFLIYDFQSAINTIKYFAILIISI